MSSLFWASERLSKVIVQGPQLAVSLGEKSIIGVGYIVIVSRLISVHPLSVWVVNSSTYNIESGPWFSSKSKVGIESYCPFMYPPDGGLIITQLKSRGGLALANWLLFTIGNVVGPQLESWMLKSDIGLVYSYTWVLSVFWPQFISTTFREI